MKAAFVTLGCKVNQYETNAMAELLKRNGYEIVGENEPADFYIVNSCTVTAESSRKSRQALRRLRHLHPDAVLALTGCYAQAYADELAALPEADVVLGNKTNTLLPEALRTFIRTRARVTLVSPHRKNDVYDGCGAASFEGHMRAFIKIQDGCNRYCTYCIIPKSRGFSRSRPLDEIALELKTIAGNGYKEVVFVGINLSSYGLERGGTICDALHLAEDTAGIERIRLGSLEPDHITDGVLEGLAQLTKFCPQFHLSLQSGSNEMLKRMNRHYSAEEYEALCGRLRRSFPSLSLTTDVIVGFPGETQRHFEETVEFVRRIGFMKVHVFPYSPREGTPAATYNDQVDKQTKTDRCALLQQVCDAERLRFFRGMCEKPACVLFETPKNGWQTGYTENYTPVRVKSDIPLTGEIRRVRITKADQEFCTGELI